MLGSIVAVLSFVCSVGNVPLAAVLWSGGISFGGAIAFLFADSRRVRGTGRRAGAYR